MPVMSDQIITMADAAKLVAPNGMAVKVIEILNQTNEILQDAPATVCNLGTTHLVTHRDSIPRSRTRMINQGSQYSKTSLVQYTESACMVEDWAQVDKKLLDIAPKGQQGDVLASQSSAKLEGISQGLAERLIYGDMGVDSAGIDGLAVRYGSLNKTKFNEARNVIDAKGTGAKLSSIYLIQWDKAAGAHLIYPKGTTAGISTKLFRDQVITDPDNKGPFEGIQVKYSAELGLAIEDWRRVVRIANVDCGELDAIVDNGAVTPASQTLIRQMILALSKLPSRSFGRTCFYMNATPFTMLEIMAMEKANVNLTYETFAGGSAIMKFKGVPLRRVDALLVGEDQVTAA